MIPVGLAFALLGLRVNEYGPKVIQVFFGGMPMGMRFTLFGLEHFIISWTASVPLLLALVVLHRRAAAGSPGRRLRGRVLRGRELVRPPVDLQ